MQSKHRKEDPQQMKKMLMSILEDSYADLDIDEVISEYQQLEEEGAEEVPDALRQKCRRAMDRERKKLRAKKALETVAKATAKVAMVTLMLIGLLTVTALSVEAVREPAVSFILEVLGEYAAVHVVGGSDSVSKPTTDVVQRLESCLPEGYFRRQYFVEPDGSFGAEYATEHNHRLYINAITHQCEMNIDAEDIHLENLVINGQKVLLVTKHGYMAMWLNEETAVLYSFVAENLDKTTVMEILEQIVTE